MSYKVENKFYDKIKQKVIDGIFTEGINCGFSRFVQDESLPKHYAYLMEYKNFKFKDVPNEAQTRQFFLELFTYNDVFTYIKNHIDEFDRQFFKDLIATNSFALIFDNNCFSIMPLDYIDEEMCSLAILQSKNRYDYEWFYSVVERKPEVLTEDLWKLGARLYAREVNSENKFLSVTPEKYKDYEYYLEMCSCNFNVGCALDTDKGRIMDTIPKEIISLHFILDLLKIDIKSVARFNEQALEMLYKEIGVQIIEEENNLFYSVAVPEGWTEENDGCWCYVKDESGNPVIDYVKRVYVPKLDQKENHGRK